MLPRPVRTATVFGRLDAWRAGLARVGVEVLDAGAGVEADLAVAPAELAEAAAASGASAVIVEGRGTRPLVRAGYHPMRLLLRPARETAALVLPLDQPVATTYAIENWSLIDRRWKRARMLAAAALARRGRLPALPGSLVSVGVRDPGPPLVIAAAAEHGVAADGGWVLTLGQGDALSRNVFHVFPPRAEEPRWIVKFARVPGFVDPFDRDQRGLELVASAGAAVAAHAPRLLARLTVEGLEVSLETAAVGRRLREILLEPGRRAPKTELVEQVASWITEFGFATRRSPEELTRERKRLAGEIVPQWTQFGVDAAIVPDVALPAVAQHNDLGSWNVVVSSSSFTVVDWETATPAGLPLWDLLYFLADALVLVDGTTAPERRPAAVARLFRGEAPSSPLLFSLLRDAVAAFSVPEAAVGPIATLCWLHHSLSGPVRDDELALWTPGQRRPPHTFEGIAEAWLADPALGPGWNRWQAR